ncbi:hypothetical protein R3W88_001121 [Solanum pinnatisectum]|uniref:Uncharacterized protein n=1 Tax=Solanum pinnatisectum TaxID=50273 RepID=A0AAV9MHM0_9SOLN|nr:hypothetical protein R3W88_001121 [Solanum pinnatisectum]
MIEEKKTLSFLSCKPNPNHPITPLAIPAAGESSLATGQTLPLMFNEHFPNLTHVTRLSNPNCGVKDPNTLPSELVVHNDETIIFKEEKYEALLKPSGMNVVDSNKGLPADKELSKPSRFLKKQWNLTNKRLIRNTDKEVTTAGMELEKDAIVTNKSFNGGGGGNEYKRMDYKFFLQKYKHTDIMAGVMKSNNVLPSQEPEDLDKALNKLILLKAEALDKALVIHKDHQVLHGDRLGGHYAVVLDMVEFEEDPLLEKLLTDCSLGSQEQVHNVRSVREFHNAVVSFLGAIKLMINRDEVENQSDHAQVVNNARGFPKGKSKKKKSKPQGEKSTRTNPMRSDRAMLK